MEMCEYCKLIGHYPAWCDLCQKWCPENPENKEVENARG